MSLSIFSFCPFRWQNEMVKLANWQDEQNENISIFPFCPFRPFCWQNEMVKLANWQNEQNEIVFVDFPILSILLILLAE